MIFRRFFTLIHTFTVLLLMATLLNAYVPPSAFPGFNLLSLAFPGLMGLNLLLCLAWILLWKKRAVLFLAISLLFLNPTLRWINYSNEKKEIPTLRIVTVNVKNGEFGKAAATKYLKSVGADLLLMQEPGALSYTAGLAYRSKDYPVVSVSSATEIVHEGQIFTERIGNAIFVDVKNNGKIIRVINVYLSPFAFDKGKVRPADDFSQNKLKAKYILKRLIPTFKTHVPEVTAIRKAVEDSPYPVILAGDFNAVPNSYEYYTLLGNLKDAFVEAGTGSSTSFHDYKLPIRIDYIFVSETIKTVSYKVDRSVKISDHYPVIAELKIE